MRNRDFRSCRVEALRAAGEGGKRTIVGHAAVYDQESELLGGWFREVIRPGAFTDALRSSDTRCLFNHDPNYVLGRLKANTLRIVDDSRGLGIECDFPDTQLANDLYRSIERGDISQMSFSFTTKDDRWTFNKADSSMPPLRELLKVDQLIDVAPVTFPAYPQTNVDARNMDRLKLECEHARATLLAAGHTPRLMRSKFDLAALEAGIRP